MLSNFIEITLQHGCSPVNMLHIFRTASYKNTYEGLLVNYYKINSFIVVLRGFLDSNGLTIIFKILEDVFSEHFSEAAFQKWQ